MNRSKSDNGSKLDDDKKFSEYRVYDGKKLTPILLKLGIEAIIMAFFTLIFVLIFLFASPKLRDNKILIYDLLIAISGIFLCFIAGTSCFISLILVLRKLIKMNNQSKAQEMLNSLTIKTLDLYLLIIGIIVTLIGFILFFIHLF
ncbi:MAG: hypothetical protein K9W45_00020 [Candidatus Heimdallarchaeum aukensis]|uniref:Uncharacterized protein n=1 Tax=Candidatus Heimdallarchaeum aukensis TaxID=2876573 RepID=A0A9Y1FLS0_9ARCH|nr:MAG: hypothetical protein K9W45_00020 [Candidatus Heimdallarchaeum aukensis]